MAAATQTRFSETKLATPLLTPVHRLWILLACFALVAVSVELMTRAIHAYRPITLENERSIEEALAIRSKAGQKQILFVGNSLIYDDLLQQAVQQEFGRSLLAHTAGIPGSTYYDWQYGLRALSGRGSQPDTLVFAISPSQFLRPAAVTPLIVSRLWRNREILAYRRDYGVSLTDTSELFLERYSTFFFFRDTMRIYVRKALPHFEELANLWARPSGAQPLQIDAEAALSERLARLKGESPAAARFMLLIAPTNQPGDAAMEPALKRAAQKAGIPVIEPVGEYGWPASRFQSDGYHLNSDAAREFSKLVAAEIRASSKIQPNDQ